MSEYANLGRNRPFSEKSTDRIIGLSKEGKCGIECQRNRQSQNTVSQAEKWTKMPGKGLYSAFSLADKEAMMKPRSVE